jgi:hypothetical protein
VTQGGDASAEKNIAATRTFIEEASQQQGSSFQFEAFALPFEAAEIARLGGTLVSAATRIAYPPPANVGASPTEFITYVTTIHDLALTYLATPGEHEVGDANKAVMQWFRHIGHAGPAFQRALGDLDARWITFVDSRGITMIDWVADPLQPVSTNVSHFGASLDGATLRSGIQTLAKIRNWSLNLSDLLGWAGDIITFYVEWQVAARTSKTPLLGRDFCLDRLGQPAYKREYETTAKLRDLVEDVDAFNIGAALMANTRRTIVEEIRELYRPGGGHTNRFSRFWAARLEGSVKEAADLTNELLSTNGIFDGIERARNAIIEAEERSKRIRPPVPRPETLAAGVRMSFCEGFAEVMRQLAETG